MNKIIHFCWFGNKKIPRKFKKYMKTWKKYLPDYEIMQWNEKNFDINITNFSKKAYENKKWAFVSDVARVYALKEYGGIYFDTDVEILKNIDNILNDEIWLGREDKEYLATAMIGVKEPNNKHINNILKIYDELDFNPNDIFKFTNPRIFTEYFTKLGLLKENENQVLEDGIHIYKKEYFNPKNYDGQNPEFTENTCIVHHFDASWTSIDEKVAIWFVRHHMGSLAKPTFKFFDLLRKIKRKIIKKKN